MPCGLLHIFFANRALVFRAGGSSGKGNGGSSGNKSKAIALDDGQSREQKITKQLMRMIVTLADTRGFCRDRRDGPRPSAGL
jgi:hypothetical protein